jgi:hypothetical protein
VRQREGLSFSEACRTLGVDTLSISARPARSIQPASPFAPDPDPPSPAWRARADRFVEVAQRTLWSDAGARARAWLAERGLTEETIRHWRLGYQRADAWEAPADWGLDGGKRISLPRGIIIPGSLDEQLWQIKVRRPVQHPEDGPKYVYVRDGRIPLLRSDALEDRPIVAIVEGELDALLLDQEAGDLIGVVTLGSSSNRLTRTAASHLLHAHMILCLHDSDQAGDVAASREQALTSRARRLHVPAGAKDITEFVQAGNNLRAWISFELERLARQRASRRVTSSAVESGSTDEVSTGMGGNVMNEPGPSLSSAATAPGWTHRVFRASSSRLHTDDDRTCGLTIDSLLASLRREGGNTVFVPVGADELHYCGPDLTDHLAVLVDVIAIHADVLMRMFAGSDCPGCDGAPPDKDAPTTHDLYLDQPTRSGHAASGFQGV